MKSRKCSQGEDSVEDDEVPVHDDSEESDPGPEPQASTSGVLVKKTDSIESLFSEKPEEKKFKRGVVYISFIPEGMTPRKLRDLLSRFAPVGRMYMQRVEEKGGKRKKKKGASFWKPPDNFSEGWVEFLKKRHAKQVASSLNNQPIGGKKKEKFREYLWNLKYLSRFKWIHLVERLSYERAVLRQKMQNEISQAKRVANFFKETVEREERQRRMLKRKGITTADADSNDNNPSPYVFAQRETVEEKKAKKSQTDGDREKFLKSLFS